MATEVEIGRRFGRWVVVKKLDYKSKYICHCDCGNESNIRVYDLLKAKSIMCKACSASTSKSPGQPVSNTTEYNTWIHINQRCGNPSNKDYVRYGGRGISVYPLWKESYEAFLMYIGKKPTPEHSIERIDVNGNYEPGNVCWATRVEQARNKRSSVFVEISGERKTVVEWSEDPICTVPLKTIYKRIERQWDPKEAVLIPVGQKRVGQILEIEKTLNNPGDFDGRDQEEE